MSSLLWFRKNLRIHDNEALIAAIDAKCTKAIYYLPTEEWLRHKVAPIKADFIFRHLQLLKRQLADLRITLSIIQVKNYAELQQHLIGYCEQHGIEKVFASQELELDEIQLDQTLISLGLPLSLLETDVVVPKGKLLTKQGSMYRVFTPFSRAWVNYIQQYGVAYIRSPPTPLAWEKKQSANNLGVKFATLDSSYWPTADQFIQKWLPNFLQNKIVNYKADRDFPVIKGTSLLSPYLAIGAISPRYIVQQLFQLYGEQTFDKGSAVFSWLNELIWREFYRHLLFHYPELIKGKNFNPKYDALSWPDRRQHFAAWCNAKTGFPIIDAAIRQLTQTGWMHNRLRMLTASFLTKHLLVNWRLGQEFFMQHLIDGDFAANNGGWQWSAGTGCDAQPYFRVFNPLTQSKKFDPQGNFIRSYLPELNDVPDSDIHFPHQYLQNKGLKVVYPSPIVDLQSARLDAIDFYR